MLGGQPEVVLSRRCFCYAGHTRLFAPALAGSLTACAVAGLQMFGWQDVEGASQVWSIVKPMASGAMIGACVWYAALATV